MAYLADNAWSHPKLANLTDRQFRVWVNSITYSSGYLTRGVLTLGQQRTIGCDLRTRNALVKAAVWDDVDGETIRIHDWDDANSKRDERREKDRDRKRQARAASTGQSAGTSSGQSTGRSTVAAHVEGVKGVKEVKEKTTSNSDAVTRQPARAAATERQPDISTIKTEIEQSLREAAAA